MAGFFRIKELWYIRGSGLCGIPSELIKIHARYILDACGIHAGYCGIHAGYVSRGVGGMYRCHHHVQRTYLRSTCIRIGLEIRNLKCIPMYPICIPLDTRSDLSVKSFPTPVGTPGGKPQRLTASAKKERERPYSHSLVLPVGASQTPFPQKAKKDCSTHAALFVFTVRVPVHPPGGAATQQIAPPTRAPAGRGPTDARHSRRARGHHGHRAATVRPQLKRLMLTEIEDQPRLRGVPRTRRACFAFMYR